MRDFGFSIFDFRSSIRRRPGTRAARRVSCVTPGGQQRRGVRILHSLVHRAVGLCAGCAPLLLPGAASAAGVAQVMSAQGKVEVCQAGQRAFKGASLMLMLDAGDQVQTARGAQATILFYKDGHREDLLAGSLARVAPDRLQVLMGKRVVDPRRLSGPALGRVQGRSLLTAAPGRAGVGALRAGPAGEAGLLVRSPVATVRAGRPALEWETAAAADRYRVALCDADGKPRAEPALSPATRLPYPDTWPALAAGEAGTIRVTALAGEKEVVTGRSGFQVLSVQGAEALAAEEPALLERLAAAPGDTPTRILLAQLYEQHNLLGEAAAQFEEVVRLNAGDPAAHRVLAHLCAAVGRVGDAAAEQAAADKIDGGKE